MRLDTRSSYNDLTVFVDAVNTLSDTEITDLLRTDDTVLTQGYVRHVEYPVNDREGVILVIMKNEAIFICRIGN